MQNNAPPVTSAELDKWFKDFPMAERKLKIAGLAKSLKVSKRTIENWRGGRVIGEKFQEGLRDFMKGRDKIELPFDPEIFAVYARKARERNMTITEYFAELAKIVGAIMLFGVFAWQAFSPDAGHPLRKFAIRRRSEENGEAWTPGDLVGDC